MKVERSRSAIRAALDEHAPAQREQFDAEYRRAVDQSGGALDTAQLDSVLDRWWGTVVILASPLSQQELDQVARARNGDFTGLFARGKDGTWIVM